MKNTIWKITKKEEKVNDLECKSFFINLMELDDNQIEKVVDKFKKFLLENFDKNFVKKLSINKDWVKVHSFYANLYWYNRENLLIEFTKYKKWYFSSASRRQLNPKDSSEINFDEKKFNKFKELEKIFIKKYKEYVIENNCKKLEEAFYKKENQNECFSKNWVRLYSKIMYMSATETNWHIDENYKIVFDNDGKVTLNDSSNIRSLPVDEVIKIINNEKIILEDLINKYNNKSIWDYVNKKDLEDEIDINI